MQPILVFADATIAARGDPTWFYSTLAQTAGALVAILGGMMISRVIPHLSLLLQEKDGIEKRVYLFSASNSS